MYANAQYSDAEDTAINCDINGVASLVPCDSANTDYANIQALVAAGELTIAPYEPPPAQPITQITMRQCRLQLLASGLLDDVDAMVLQADRAVRIDWEYATVVDRSSPLVESIGLSLGLSNDDIDNLFTEASKI